MNSQSIHIFSSKGDAMTLLVCEWLLAFKSNFNVIYADEFCDITIEIGVNSIPYNHVLWFRRGRPKFFNAFERGVHVVDYLVRDQSSIIEYLEQNATTVYGSYIKEIRQNKLNYLQIAKFNDFAIPETLITTNKKDLLYFRKMHSRIITKEISNIMNVIDGNNFLNSKGAFEILDEHINKLNKHFDVTLFQKLIVKQFEIRVFYFAGNLFAMAIFQDISEATIDVRDTSSMKSNRNVPYKLDRDTTSKLKSFFKMAGLNTGSVDLLLDKDGVYYFLEVNIQGEFHWLSESCNYYIEKEIAKSLITSHNEIRG